MASISWRGGAPAVAQVNTYAFAGTWIVGEKVTVTIGAKAWIYTIASTTIATFLDALIVDYDALDTSVYPEQTELTPTRSTSSLVMTSNTAGKPFTATISTNSASGTIGGGASSTGSATTVSSGPLDVSTAANWSAGAIPANSDTVTIDLEGARLRYGLDQNGITLAALNITAKDVEIGLPKANVDGTSYPEYRSDSWKISATLAYVNTNSGRIKLNFGTAQTTYTQGSSGNGVENDIPAVLLQGTHASNVWNFFGGQAGMAFFATDSFTGATVRLDQGMTLIAGATCTIATINNYGGTLTAYCAITTALNHPSSARAVSRIQKSGAVAQITSQGGQIYYNSIGTLGGNTILGNSAFLSFDEDQRPKTVTNPIGVYSPSVQFADNFASISGGFQFNFVNCIGTIRLKPNSSIVVAAL